MSTLVWTIVLGYLWLILCIGAYAARKIRDTSDYLLAGRHLNAWILAGTLAATVLDGGATLGVVGHAYGKWGISAFWYVAAMGIAFLILSFLMPYLRRTEARTVPEYFRIRYGKTAGLLHSILTMISMIGITAAQLKASATVIEVMTGMAYNTSLLIVSVIIAVYSMMGGFWSVALTDGIQLVLTFVGMGAAIPFAYRMTGGWHNIVNSLSCWGTARSFVGGIGGVPEILAYILLFVATFAVGEDVASAFFAAEDDRAAKRGPVIAGIVVILFSFVPMILGLLLQVLSQTGGLNSGVIQALNQDPKYALPALAISSMPPALVGIVFAGILSATMSSADSSLVGAGSVYVNDVYRVFVNSEADTERQLGIAKVAMVFVMVASFFTAIYGGNILNLLAFSFAIRAAGTFVPYTMAHIWKQSSALACVLSIMVGTGVYIFVLVGRILSSQAAAVFPAILASALVFFVFSGLAGLFGKKQDDVEDTETEGTEAAEEET